MARLRIGSTLLALTACACRGQYVIQEVAGTRFPEGASATAVSVGAIFGIAAAPNGDVFLSSYDTARIFRVTSSGNIFTYAQSPVSRIFDDLLYPTGLALDSAGNLFVASMDNNYLKRIDPSGAITTVAGNGTTMPSGAGAAVAQPSYVAVDRNDAVYVNSQVAPGIVKVDRSGRISFPFRTPIFGVLNGIAIDSSGAAYATFKDKHSVMRFGLDGASRVVAGGDLPGFSGDGGPAIAAKLFYPFGLATDPSDNLFVADLGNGRIRKIGTDGVISSWPAGPSDCSPCFNSPVVATDPSGNVYSTVGSNQVWRLDPSGRGTVIAGNAQSSYSGDGGPALFAQFNGPSGVQLDSGGNLLIADTGNGAIRKIDSSGNVTSPISGVYTDASGFPPLLQPSAIAFGPVGDMFVADSGLHEILHVNTDGTVVAIAGTGTAGFGGDNGAAMQATLNEPRSIVFDGSGNLFIAERSGNRIRKIDTAGIVTTICGTGTAGFGGDGGPATKAQLQFPNQIAFDAAGNLLIADSGNNRIRKIDGFGVISTVTGTGVAGFKGDGGPASLAQLWDPSGIAVDGAGNLFIGDRGNDRIRRVDANGIVITVAGDGTKPVSTNQLTLDASGNLYAVQGNGVYRIAPPAP